MNHKSTLPLAIITICALSGWGAKDSNIAGDDKQSINFYGTLTTWADPKQKIKVDNISIENIFRKIPMYVKQTKMEQKKAEQDAAEKVAKSAQQAAKSAQQAAQAAKKAAKQQDNAAATAAADAAQAAQDAAQAATEAAAAVSKVKTKKTDKTKEHILSSDPKTSLIEAEIDLVEISAILVPFPDEVWVYQKDSNSRKYEFVQVTLVSNDVKKTKTDYLVEKWKKIYCDRISAAGPGEQKVPLTALKRLTIEGYKDRALERSRKKQEEEREKIKRLASKENKAR